MPAKLADDLHHISVRVTLEHERFLDRLSREVHMSRSHVVRLAIDHLMKSGQLDPVNRGLSGLVVGNAA